VCAWLVARVMRLTCPWSAVRVSGWRGAAGGARVFGPAALGLARPGLLPLGHERSPSWPRGQPSLLRQHLDGTLHRRPGHLVLGGKLVKAGYLLAWQPLSLHDLPAHVIRHTQVRRL